MCSTRSDAPGSRSSPLAVSACYHPLTTCISCFDERSLAFHAVGYAKGSQKPAVVITSSGTVVSNLLPAVVEASYDHVPMLLLTADRPPELQDAGANQSINQVNHFGKFVRFFFSLPAPDDEIPARMVLTTIDSAVYFATQEPYGPVHINCPFREPLDCSPMKWNVDCLRGMDQWVSKLVPFTRYMKLQHACGPSLHTGCMVEILELIKSATQGLIIIGSIRTEDESLAAAHLVKHLRWPVVTDVLSGLRIRRVLSSSHEIEDLFIDHLDHILLSESVKNWLQLDVVLQIGSRITSKRVSNLLEFSAPSSYILIDQHPHRHDPSHILTHRIQSTISEFAGVLLRNDFPRKAERWASFLKLIDTAVAQEISFHLHSEHSLTEPYVAHVIGEELKNGSVMFLGNSMVIRDIDMYGKGFLNSINNDMRLVSVSKIPFRGFQVVGNRGASGIDGLLSTAVGFSVGSQKRVFCLIGDVSFLHDTNGLAILNERIGRKPMTILAINNHGGGIFSLLPIAKRVKPDLLSKFFYTAHDVSIKKLCAAHSVRHVLAKTKKELHNALWSSQEDCSDCVIEVESCIEDNADFHRIISKFACQAANQAFELIMRLSSSSFLCHGSFCCKIDKAQYSMYRIQLHCPPTSSQVNTKVDKYYREGLIMSILLDDNTVGFGEVAPIEIHEESLLDAEEQLKFLLHKLEGSVINFLPLLKGSFSKWIWRTLGIPPSSVYPSVKCGIEMALLNAITVKHESGLFDITAWQGSSLGDSKTDLNEIQHPEHIQICALVECNGSPQEVAQIVSQLVDEGFTTVKIKVARRKSPMVDAMVIKEIRKLVGYKIKIRVDANRRWKYEDAIQFGVAVEHFNLQFIEEPVCLEDDIIKFCRESGLPVALDETIDNIKGDFVNKLQQFVHPGIVAMVVKPSVVGGFENAAVIAKWAQLHDKMVVISSAFESSLSLSAYIQFANYIEQQNAEICKIKNRVSNTSIAHCFGTYKWLKEDVVARSVKVRVSRHCGIMGASLSDARCLTRNFQINNEIIQRNYQGEQLNSYRKEVHGDCFSGSFKLQETGKYTKNMTVVYLHGFLGTSDDWVPIMRTVAPTARCIAIDLPGHGETKVHTGNIPHGKLNLSVEAVGDILMKLILEIASGLVVLVGYSMGARIALYMTLKYYDKISGAVIISGSPGLEDEASKKSRRAQDEARSRLLHAFGLKHFLETWYLGNLWKSLREHPHFSHVLHSRARHEDIHVLAETLSGLSIGKQQSLWKELKTCRRPLLLVVGEKDTKFREISKQMLAEISGSKDYLDKGEQVCERVVIPDCGHAVHLENPLPVIKALRNFLTFSIKGCSLTTRQIYKL